MRRLYERYKGYAMSIGLRYIPDGNDVEDVVQDSFAPVSLPDDEPELERIPPEELTAMIAQLPAGCRLILNLYVFEHCSHTEIAQRLGIKENSSTSQLARAKQMLMKMMKDYIKRHEI